MKTYEVKFSASAIKALKRIDRKWAAKLFAAVQDLAHTPRPHSAKKLVGKSSWRIRVGDYRVVYDIHDDVLVILVIKIAHRKDVYKK